MYSTLRRWSLGVLTKMDEFVGLKPCQCFAGGVFSIHRWSLIFFDNSFRMRRRFGPFYSMRSIALRCSPFLARRCRCLKNPQLQISADFTTLSTPLAPQRDHGPHRGLDK